MAKTQAVYVRLTTTQREQLEALTKQNALSDSISDHIRAAVEEYLKKQAQAASVVTH